MRLKPRTSRSGVSGVNYSATHASSKAKTTYLIDRTGSCAGESSDKFKRFRLNGNTQVFGHNLKSENYKLINSTMEKYFWGGFTCGVCIQTQSWFDWMRITIDLKCNEGKRTGMCSPLYGLCGDMLHYGVRFFSSLYRNSICFFACLSWRWYIISCEFVVIINRVLLARLIWFA